MRTADRVGLLLAQMIDLLRESPGSTDDLKSALRALVEIADKRSLSVRAEPDGIVVEGVAVEGDAVPLQVLHQQMEAHLVAELRIAHGASALDIMHLIRSIAHNLSDYGRGHLVEEHLASVGATTVSVVSRSADASRDQRREMRITEALEATDIKLDQAGKPARASTPKASPVSPTSSSPAVAQPTDADGGLELVSEHTGQAYDDMVRHLLASAATMSDAIGKLEADAPGQELLKQLDTVQGTVTKAFDNQRVDQAIDAVAALIKKETASSREESRRAYGIALRRLLTDQNIKRFAAYLLDDLYAQDVVLIIQRAGKPGTKIILELLVKAPTFAERKAYLRLLRDAEESAEAIAGMLGHPDWFVIRNMADLAGELRIAEAVPGLGKVIGHSDDRVRKSVGIALARIGTSATVPHLRKVLRDKDGGVRIAVFAEVGGKGQSALAMPLVTAVESEDDPKIRAEFLRTMGRIGTPEAVEALKKAAAEKTGLLKRKASTDSLAAVEGLALANSPTAVAALENLKTQGPKDVRDAAKKALRGTLQG